MEKYSADNSEVDTPTKVNVTDDFSELFSEMECSVPEFKLSRKECPQMVVGDGATTKNIRFARHNNLSRYSNISEFSGDFHCSWYVEECFAKAQGPGGLYHAVNKVLGKSIEHNGNTFSVMVEIWSLRVPASLQSTGMTIW